VKTQTKFAIALISVLLSTATASMAQKVPVSIQARYLVNDDKTAVKFSLSLADEIQLSAKFSLWTGKLSELPSNGVCIFVRSIQVKTTNGEELGSAIFIEADRASGKDPGYFKIVRETMWMIPKDGSVADETRGFLVEVDKKL
jgi:hypothetical protein